MRFCFTLLLFSASFTDTGVHATESSPTSGGLSPVATEFFPLHLMPQPEPELLQLAPKDKPQPEPEPLESVPDPELLEPDPLEPEPLEPEQEQEQPRLDPKKIVLQKTTGDILPPMLFFEDIFWGNEDKSKDEGWNTQGNVDDHNPNPNPNSHPTASALALLEELPQDGFDDMYNSTMFTFLRDDEMKNKY